MSHEELDDGAHHFVVLVDRRDVRRRRCAGIARDVVWESVSVSAGQVRLHG